MKSLIYIFIATFLLNSGICFTQVDYYYYEDNEGAEAIKAQNISSLTIVEYKSELQFQEKEGSEVNKTYYDSLGRVTLEVDCFSPNMRDCDTLKYFYDKLGNQTKCIWIWDDTKQIEVSEYEYDDRLLIKYREYTLEINTVISKSDSFLIVYDDKHRMKYEIDKFNDTITVCKYQNDSSIEVLHPKTGHRRLYKSNKSVFSDYKKYKYSWEYDKQDRLIFLKYINQNNEIIHQTEFMYKNGLLTQSRRTDDDGTLENIHLFIYEKYDNK